MTNETDIPVPDEVINAFRERYSGVDLFGRTEDAIYAEFHPFEKYRVDPKLLRRADALEQPGAIRVWLDFKGRVDVDSLPEDAITLEDIQKFVGCPVIATSKQDLLYMR